MMAGPKAITGKIAKVDQKPTNKSKSSKSGGLSASEKKAIAAGLGNVAKDTTKVLGLLGQYLAGETAGSTGGGISGNRTDASYIAEGRSGTSNTGQNYINGNEWMQAFHLILCLLPPVLLMRLMMACQQSIVFMILPLQG